MVIALVNMYVAFIYSSTTLFQICSAQVHLHKFSQVPFFGFLDFPSSVAPALGKFFILPVFLILGQ